MNRRERIKDRLFNKEFLAKQEWWGDEETILVSEEIRQLPLIVRKALAIKHMAEHMHIEIKPDELIVGIPTMASVGFGKCFPEYALPEELEEGARWGFTPKSVFGHRLLNYETVVQKGLCGVREDVMRKLSELTVDEKFEEKTTFYRSVLISLDALRILAQRYTDLLLTEAEKEQDAARRQNCCRWRKCVPVFRRIRQKRCRRLRRLFGSCLCCVTALWNLFLWDARTSTFIPSIKRTWRKDASASRRQKRLSPASWPSSANVFT